MGVPMRYNEHPPLFLGLYPLTVGVQLVCVVHALVCILVVSLASSVVAVDFLDFHVSPDMQVSVAAWHLLGVALVASALVGTLWRQALPLRAYFAYLLAATLSWLALMAWVYQNDTACSVIQESKYTQRVGLSFSCGVITAAWQFGSWFVFVAAAYSCWLVWSLQDDIDQREATQHLLEHEPAHIKKLRQGFDATPSPHGTDLPPVAPMAGPTAAPAHAAGPPPAVGWAAPLPPGEQPAWGSVQIRAARMTA